MQFYLSFIWVKKTHRVFVCTCFTLLPNTVKIVLFTGLEQFVEQLPSLINQIRSQLDSDKMIILEHFERNLEDVFDILNIFENKCPKFQNVTLETDITQF